MQSPDLQQTIRVEKQRQFIRAMSKSIDGRPVTQHERALLEAIFEALLRGQDVSDLTGIRRPHNRRSADQFHIALHYLCLTKLMHEKAAAAWRTVADAWGLKQRDVRWVIARNRAPALAVMQQFAGNPDQLLRLCKQHAQAAGSAARVAGSEQPSQGCRA
jgi:hypothetical protein